MWNFLKKTFRRKEEAPQIQVTGFRDGLLSFRSEGPLAPRQHLTIETPTPGGTLKATVDIESYDADSQEYVARIEGGDAAVESLDIDLSSLITVSRVLRVSSLKLPSYTALTREISPSGLKMTTSEPLNVGDRLPLDIEFDWPKIGTLRLFATVSWCTPKGKRTYLSGLRFEDIDPGTFALLTQYVRLCR